MCLAALEAVHRGICALWRAQRWNSTLHLVPVLRRTVPSVSGGRGAALLTEVQGGCKSLLPVHLGKGAGS